MRRILLAVGMASLLACSVLSEELKIGYVDTMEVYKESDLRKEKYNRLEDEVLVEEARLDVMKKEIANLQKELEEKGKLLSEEAKEKIRRKRDEKLDELDEKKEKVQRMVDKREEEIFKLALKEISKVISELGRKEGYDLILEKRMVLYGNEEMDLTVEVIEKLNKRRVEGR